MTDPKTPPLADDTALRAALDALPGWSRTDDGRGIERCYRFKGFNAAFAFMTRTALLAEKMDHHPEWSNVFDRVEVRLTTHSAGGVTTNDLDMAKRIEGLCQGHWATRRVRERCACADARSFSSLFLLFVRGWPSALRPISYVNTCKKRRREDRASAHAQALRSNIMKREPLRPGDESVWDYPRPPRLEPVAAVLRVVVGGRDGGRDQARPPRLGDQPPADLLHPQGRRPPRPARSSLGRQFVRVEGASAVLDAHGSPPDRAGRLELPRPDALLSHHHRRARLLRLQGRRLLRRRRASPTRRPATSTAAGSPKTIKGPFKGAAGTWGW